MQIKPHHHLTNRNEGGSAHKNEGSSIRMLPRVNKAKLTMQTRCRIFAYDISGMEQGHTCNVTGFQDFE